MNRIDGIRRVRAKLKRGQASIGSWMQIPHPSIAEIMGDGGYDWVAIDLEHGSVGTHQLPDLCRALELGNTLPLVRLAQGHSKDCKAALDAGAGGVIVPMIESAEQLREIVKSSCWPPAGRRGVGFSRANLFGRHFESYSEEAQQPLIVAQIEHVAALAVIDDILEVEGLDAVMIGPYDLSASMGITGRFDHQKYLSALEAIRNKADQHGISVGLHVVSPSPAELSLRMDEGFTFIAYSIDAVFLARYSDIRSITAEND